MDEDKTITSKMGENCRPTGQCRDDVKYSLPTQLLIAMAEARYLGVATILSFSIAGWVDDQTHFVKLRGYFSYYYPPYSGNIEVLGR